MAGLGLATSLLRPFALDDYVRFVGEAEARGYTRVWTGETSGSDAVTTMAVVATHTRQIGLANGIIPVQTRTPHVLAMTAATLGTWRGAGCARARRVEPRHRRRIVRPALRAALAQLREAVELIRRILAGERVTFEGQSPARGAFASAWRRLASRRDPISPPFGRACWSLPARSPTASS